MLPSCRIAGVALTLAMAVTLPASAQSQSTLLVLMPGAGGNHPDDFLVRNVPAFAAAGFRSVVTTDPSEAAALIASHKNRGVHVVLVGMSLGSGHVATAIASGARPDKLVVAAGDLMGAGLPSGSVAGNLGNARLLPATLVLHHRDDACPKTPPHAVPAFQAWARGKARIAWISGGGGNGSPCRLRSAHAFMGVNDVAAAAIIRFARSR
jgi:dienelactone hydrolase